MTTCDDDLLLPKDDIEILADGIPPKRKYECL
jgi:hypothetical protein